VEVGVLVAVTVGVRVAVAVAVRVAVAVGGTGVTVGVRVTVAVGVRVAVAVGVRVTVAVGVRVAVDVAGTVVAVTVAVGVLVRWTGRRIGFFSWAATASSSSSPITVANTRPQQITLSIADRIRLASAGAASTWTPRRRLTLVRDAVIVPTAGLEQA
jgi:hypothetical protein